MSNKEMSYLIMNMSLYGVLPFNSDKYMAQVKQLESHFAQKTFCHSRRMTSINNDRWLNSVLLLQFL